MENSDRLKLGVALSGGGARGIIHIGVLKALDDARIKPSCISGTSIGAIVGGLYAGGVSPGEMLKLISGKSFLRMFSIKPSFSGLLEMKYLKKVLRDHLPERFDQLDIPFHACATNLNKHKRVLFSEGTLYRAIVASASIPLLFEPVIIDGDAHVDGGVIDNLPTDICRNSCDKILGVEVNAGMFHQDLKNIKNIAIEVFQLTVSNNTKEGLAHCDWIIQPQLEAEYQILDFTKANELYEIGLEEGRKFVKKLVSSQKEKSSEFRL
ncbi:MAG TPA: patatin-like phospholipase family protein [Cryomorphaceae bacterium]|nr:patatin-like phospholipase family protein [Cryomorphaceae bacterium]